MIYNFQKETLQVKNYIIKASNIKNYKTEKKEKWILTEQSFKKKKKTNKNVFLQTYRSTDPEQFDPRQWRNFLRKTRQLVALRLARNTLRERRMYE